MFFVLKFELILIIGSNNVLTEGARKVYRGRRVVQGWFTACLYWQACTVGKVAYSQAAATKFAAVEDKGKFIPVLS
jgi:hypothetical protein